MSGSSVRWAGASSTAHCSVWPSSVSSASTSPAGMSAATAGAPPSAWWWPSSWPPSCSAMSATGPASGSVIGCTTRSSPRTCRSARSGWSRSAASSSVPSSLAALSLIAGWRSDQRGSALVGIAVAGFAAGGFVGAIYASTRYDAPDGVLGLAIMLGLITWIVAGVLAGLPQRLRSGGTLRQARAAGVDRGVRADQGVREEQWSSSRRRRMLGR